MKKRQILAFTHIKKAAGTTLSHILRINYFMRHCDVKVLSRQSGSSFQAVDLFKLFQINPFIRSIGGHSVVPFGDLGEHFENMRFITLVRDPVRRYLSQYQHNVEKMGYQGTFEAFLNNQTSWNKQVWTIAGSADLHQAKRILRDRFFLVGITEAFDEFLILLKNKLRPKFFRPEYRIQNIGQKDSSIRKKLERCRHEYTGRIQERNALDMELYDYVRTKLIPKEIENYGTGFSADVQRFKDCKKDYSSNPLWYMDFFVRRFYYRPMIRYIRKKEGFQVS